MRRLFLSILALTLCLSAFAQDNNQLEKYVSEYYTYMKSLPVPKPDKSVLTEIMNLSNTLKGESFIIEEVIPVEGKTKDEIYEASWQYLVDNFKDSKSVIQMQDKSAGIIVGKGIITAVSVYNEFLVGPTNYYEKVSFTLKTQCKDGRFKVEIYNISYADVAGVNTPIETLLDEQFYTIKEQITILNTIDHSSKRYINMKTQVLITSLHKLYSLKNELKEYASKYKGANEW